MGTVYSNIYYTYYMYSVSCASSGDTQADEGPVKEGGLTEAQGAGGEEQECSTDGGGQEEGGQSVWELPAGEGEPRIPRVHLLRAANICVYCHERNLNWVLQLAALKDTLRQKVERIEELEEALRESVQINAEREMVLAQEESARSLQEKQVPPGSQLHLSPAQPH